MNATHLIVKRDTRWPVNIKTACGRVGSQEERVNNEFSTVRGDRFEAEDSRRKTTCKSCLRATAHLTPHYGRSVGG